MSVFSGKCDLYDTIMMQHFRCKNGSDKKEDLDKTHIYYSDELECFNEFKKKTNGVIYQHLEIKVTEQNQELIEKKCSNFKVIKHIREVEDKRCKDNKRKETTYTYEYFGKEYTLKELNKKGVYITREIKFNTLLDIIPYYPYLVTTMYSSNDELKIFISKESFVDTEGRKFLQAGYESTMCDYYRKELQKHYIDVVQRYYTPKEENIMFELIKFDENRIGKTQYPIDDRFEVEWFFKDKTIGHWCDPKVVNYEEGILAISKEDYDNFIGHECYVKYIKYEKPRLYLD